MGTIDSDIVINIKDATAALAQSTYGELIVIGEDDSATAEFNKVYTFYDQDSVESKYGADSPISKATAKAFAQGVNKVKTVNVVDSGPTVDYDTVLNALQTEEVDYDIIVTTQAADDANMDSKLVSHANTYKKLLVIPFLGTQSAAVTAFGDLTANEFLYCVSHDDDSTYTSGELSGAVAGVIGLTKSWNPVSWKTVSGIEAATYTPSDIDTLVTNNINTVISIANNELSGSLILTGSFVDVPRTKIYLYSEIKAALTNLKLRLANKGEKIPYSPAGIGMIKAKIEEVLRRAQRDGALRENYTDDNGDLVKGFTVSVPSYDSISDSDKSNRVLKNVVVIAYISGAIESVELDLVVTL